MTEATAGFFVRRFTNMDWTILTPEARENLDKVVKALADRPALSITVTGTAHLEREREGLRREGLQQLVLAEKRRANPVDTSPVTPAEWKAVLQLLDRKPDA